VKQISMFPSETGMIVGQSSETLTSTLLFLFWGDLNQQGFMRIKFDPALSNGAFLVVHNLIGKKIKEYSLTSDQTFQEVELPGLSSGVYFITLRKGTSVLATDKFIIK